MWKYTLNETHWWLLSYYILFAFSAKQNNIFDQSRNFYVNCVITVETEQMRRALHACVGDAKKQLHQFSAFLSWYLASRSSEVKISLSWALHAWNDSPWSSWFKDTAVWIGKTARGWVEVAVFWPRLNSTSGATSTQLSRDFIFYFSWLLLFWFQNLSSLTGKSCKAFSGKNPRFAKKAPEGTQFINIWIILTTYFMPWGDSSENEITAFPVCMLI